VVSLNFDDGYESAYDIGLPIVEAAGFKTTQFIITKRLDTAGYLTTGQVLAMQNSGHEIGAHSRTHPHLSTLTAAQQQDEIVGSLTDLEAIGVTPISFAYPYGDYDDTTLSIVSKGCCGCGHNAKCPRGISGHPPSGPSLRGHALEWRDGGDRSSSPNCDDAIPAFGKKATTQTAAF
jgi:hypothetical protein